MKTRLLGTLLLTPRSGGRKSTPPAWPSAADVRWSIYARDDVGFRVAVADAFRPEQNGDDTAFYANGFPIFRVLWVEEEAAL